MMLFYVGFDLHRESLKKIAVQTSNHSQLLPHLTRQELEEDWFSNVED